MNTEVLRAHRDGPQRLSNLQEQIEWAAEATIRGSIGYLREAGALEKCKAEGASNAVATVLTFAGADMLAVTEVLEDWLGLCPEGPILIGDEYVKVAVKALAEGWSSTLIRALAASPRSLTELSGLIPEVSYPSLERRIGWMRASGQIAALPKESRGIPYAPTDWLRRAVAPLCVASRCERHHLDGVPPITDVEVEAAFLLTLPLVRLPEASRGRCLLASRTDAAALEGGAALAGVAVEIAGGEVGATTVDLEDDPVSWAIGSSDVWLDAVIDDRLENLRIGGKNPQLACDLVHGLHLALATDR